MTWTDLTVASLVAAVFLVLPGLIVGWVAHLRGFLLVALAPALSTSAIGGGAVAAGLSGLPWSWWTPLATAIGLAAVVWLVLRLPRQASLDVETPGVLRTVGHDLPLWGGLALAVTLLVRQVTVVLGRPDAISQTFDNIFHMAAVRHAVESGNASSLTIAGVNQLEGDPSFYPAAFHGVASLVLQYGTDDIAVAVNATAMVITALVWPLGALALVRLALPESAAGVLGAAVLTTSFTAFPLFLLEFGVLYPNLFGLALLPVMYGLGVQLLGLHSRRHVRPTTAGLLLLVMLPGIVLAHPNALMVLVAVGFAPVLAWSVRSWSAEWSTRRRTRSLALTGAVTAGYLGISAAAWQVVRPSATASIWTPILTAPHAVGEAVTNAAPGGGRAAWLASIVVVIGMGVASRTGRWWLVGSWATIVALWVVVTSFAVSDLRDYLTGIWYNDPWRFAATVSLVAFPLGALALHTAAGWVTEAGGRLLAGIGRVEPTRPTHGAIGAAVTLVMVAALVVGTQRGSYMLAALNRASGSYALTSTSPLLTADEYALLMRTPQTVGENAVVATNPWNGSSMLFALTGIRTTNTHASYRPTDDQVTLRYELDGISDSLDACRAVQRLSVTHALDFGIQEVEDRRNPYPGLIGLGDAKGFREVDREGSAVLYELTLCR